MPRFMKRGTCRGGDEMGGRSPPRESKQAEPGRTQQRGPGLGPGTVGKGLN